MSVMIVTGGAQGIGRAVAKRLAADGAQVAVWDTLDDGGEETTQACRTAGSDSAFWHVDVGDPVQVEKAAADVERRWGVPEAS